MSKKIFYIVFAVLVTIAAYLSPFLFILFYYKHLDLPLISFPIIYFIISSLLFALATFYCQYPKLFKLASFFRKFASELAIFFLFLMTFEVITSSLDLIQGIIHLLIWFISLGFIRMFFQDVSPEFEGVFRSIDSIPLEWLMFMGILALLAYFFLFLNIKNNPMCSKSNATENWLFIVLITMCLICYLLPLPLNYGFVYHIAFNVIFFILTIFMVFWGHKNDYLVLKSSGIIWFCLFMYKQVLTAWH